MCSQVNQETTAVENHEQAENSLAQGKLDKAQAACQKALAVVPDFAPAYKTLGNISLDMGKMEEAMDWYTKALATQPDWAEVYADIGSLYAIQNQWQSAIDCYEKAIALQPKVAGFYLNLAKAWQSIGKSELVAECYEQALTQESDSVTASEYLSLGKTLFKQKKLTEALACYRQASKLDPGLSDTYHLWGNVLVTQGKLNQAISCYQKALELTPDKWEYYKFLGKCLQKLHKWNRAIACYSKAIELNPHHPNNYYLLGKILEKQKKSSEAVSIYQQGLKKLPENSQLVRRIERLLNQQKQNLVENYRTYGETQKQIDNLESAISVDREIIKREPQTSNYYELGMLLVKQEDFEGALLCYEEILKMQPWSEDKAQKNVKLGIALVKAEKLREIINCYHKIFDKNIQNLEFYYQFSISISTAGLISEAVNFFKELPKAQFPKQVKQSTNVSNNSIYDSIWDALNQTSSDNFDLNQDLEGLELKSQEIQKHFSRKKLKVFQIDKLHPKEIKYIENSGIVLEYVKLIRIENHHLENIYINYFESTNGVVKTRTNNVKKKELKKDTGEYKYQAIEFTQSLVEFGYIYAVCPLSGRVVRSNTSFYLERLTLIYRFEGEEVFYIILNDFIGSKAALYIPKLNICIAFGGTKKTVTNIPQHIAYKIYKFQSYAVSNWRDVENYLGNFNKSLVEVYGTMKNLGHFFWQDVTGIYYLYEQNLLEKIDYFCGGWNQYLNLLSIFPEIPENKILDMSEMSGEEQFRFMLKNNFLVVRITDAFIKQSVGKRIAQAGYNLCSQEFIEEVRKAKENNNLLLWINVRTHNKVWVDQDENYPKIINSLIDDFSDLSIGIVFDGTPDASDSVKKIIEKTKSKVNFYNTNLKIKLYESIVWANNIDAYIAVVGSGLVITSWLTDKPGVAHGDRAHLGQKSFWYGVKEAGIRPTFLTGQDIQQLNTKAYGNYKVNWKIIYKKILNILKKVERQKRMSED